MNSNNSTDLTEGNIYTKLLVFAVPFLIANFLQALYGAVDMAIVGWFSNASGLSAVATGSQVMQIITSIISGLTMGGTILIAQYFGGGKDNDTIETISTMLTLFALVSIVLTAVMLAVTSPILKALQTPPEAFIQAKQYVIISVSGIIFIFGYNAISSMLRGLGDSKSPLIFIIIACLTNIVLDLLLVGVFKMGPAGAALATVASQAVSMILAILYLSKHDFIFDFKFKSFKIHKDKVTKLLKLGFPISLQDSMVSLSFLFITAIVNSLGVVSSAAVGICGKFDGFAMLPAMAFSSAIASMSAQNIGAGYPDRAKQAMNAGISLSFACSIVFFLWVQICPQSIMSIFKADAAVTAAGVQYMKSFSFDFIMVSFVFCMNGFFNGCGHTSFSMINGLISTVVLRVPMAYLLSIYIPWGLFGLGMAAPLASFMSIVIGFVYIKSNRWKEIKL